MPVLEASIQRAVVKYARDRGVVAIKMSTSGPRGAAGWLDFLFLYPTRRCLWIEFKRPGGRVTPLQAKRIEQLRGLGWEPHVVDDVSEGCGLINYLIRTEEDYGP